MNTVVFDLGGVLVDWDPRYLLRKVMPGREAEMEAILTDVLNREWNLARDRGDSWSDAMARLQADYPQWADIFELYTLRWAETLGGAHEDTVAVLRELHEQGTPLYALSNWSAQMFPHAEDRFEWLSWFEGIVVSGRIGRIKPDRDIFEYLMETYGLQAADLFFIDDHEPNVQAARALGIGAHVFQGAADLRAELVSQGFLEPRPVVAAALPPAAPR